ncbi:MAG: biotin synthase, partial [Terriglobia bacterium]
MKSASTITTSAQALRHDWTREEVRSIYDQPLLELVFQAQQVHRQHHNPQEVQTCRLLSIKTGGCP